MLVRLPGTPSFSASPLRTRRRGPRSAESLLSRSQARQGRIYTGSACGQISAGETLDPLLDLQGGEAEIDVVHAGPPLVSPDQGADIRAEDCCDGAPAYPAESLPTRLAFLRPLLTCNTRLVGLGCHCFSSVAP